MIVPIFIDQAGRISREGGVNSRSRFAPLNLQIRLPNFIILLGAAPLLLHLNAMRAPANAIKAQDEKRGGDEAVEYYEKKVRPILAEHCYECHGPDVKNPEGGLRLDRPESWLRGGDSGAAVVPGDPEKSRLARAIRYEDHDLEMPPVGKLKIDDIRIIENWIRAGAVAQTGVVESRPQSTESDGALWKPGGGSSGVERARAHWAFQSYKKPDPPIVMNPSWVRNEVDAFVLSQLESVSMQPAPQADRNTWLRRVTWDLTGLPPTEQEYADFASDTSPAAYEKVADRLLASPAYGERWARLWLDLARYADSNGLDENLALGNAWRYRDYVVKAFNTDKPYNQFVTEQLAGDLLPEPANEDQLRDQLTATGFLVLGPKMLAEQDKEKLLMDTVDEQIDVTSKAFLGLTAGCARCHDHKFDPIPTRDYYALAGVFRSTSTFDNTGFVSRWRQRELKNAAARKSRDEWVGAHTAAEKEWKASFAASETKLVSRWRADFAKYLSAASEISKTAILLQAEEFSRGTLGVDKETWGTADTVIARTTMAGAQYAEYDVTVTLAGKYELLVRMASVDRRPMNILLNGTIVGNGALGETTGSYYVEGQKWFSVGTLALNAGRNVLRLDGTVASIPHLDVLVLTPFDGHDVYVLWPGKGAERADGLDQEVLRQFVLYLNRESRVPGSVFTIWNTLAAIPSTDYVEQAPKRWMKLKSDRDTGLLKGPAPILALLDAPSPASLLELAARYQSVFATIESMWKTELERAAKEKREAPKTLADSSLETLRAIWLSSGGPFDIARRQLELAFPDDERKTVTAARVKVDTLEKKRPAPFDLALGVTDGTVSDLPIHVRGSHLNKTSESVPRGFLSVLNHLVPSPVITSASSGRFELAQWITDPKNPLTARVMVNRIWQGHFGIGIVATSSNFGFRGEKPTNPELLNWLAAKFVESNWSIKAMHRLIVTSATYRMSSRVDRTFLLRDAENKYLWRMNRRRMDAESIRDHSLAVCGKLDRTLGGSLLMTKDGDYVTNDQSSDQARYSTNRRSIYLPVIRNSMFDLFTSFDYNDASIPIDRRPATTAAHQSLFLLNSPFAQECAQSLAADLLQHSASDDARILQLWNRVLARAPLPHERERASAFLAQARSIEHGESPPVTAGGPESAPADSGKTHNNTMNSDSIETTVWRSLCQVLLASNEFLFID